MFRRELSGGWSDRMGNVEIFGNRENRGNILSVWQTFSLGLLYLVVRFETVWKSIISLIRALHWLSRWHHCERHRPKAPFFNSKCRSTLCKRISTWYVRTPFLVLIHRSDGYLTDDFPVIRYPSSKSYRLAIISYKIIIFNCICTNAFYFRSEILC